MVTVQTTRRADRDAQWRAWLAASETRGRGAALKDVADLTRHGEVKRRWGTLGWRLIRGAPLAAAAVFFLMN